MFQVSLALNTQRLFRLSCLVHISIHRTASLVPPTLADALGTASVAPVEMQPGDYVVVDVVGAGVNQLNVTPVARTTIKEAAAMLGNCLASPSYYLG